ncbi:MAG: phage integrase N-terminal SAM-like domain-containing protein [Pseudomonadales bacterium]|nr:phage integrase N-terminal SAM-like domain-containing protein [Pseudomonadales bacterium]
MKLIGQLQETLRLRHYSYRTEQAYVGWTTRYIRFHKLRHPIELHDEHVAAFLTHLAVKRRVSASTQNQALNALALRQDRRTRYDIHSLPICYPFG